MLIIPKFLILLTAISAELNETGNSRINNIKENEIFLCCNSSIRNYFLFQEYQLYAISELKYKNNETFCRYLLILSGGVELNPGPDFSCSICNKTIPSDIECFVAIIVILGYIKNVPRYQKLNINLSLIHI